MKMIDAGLLLLQTSATQSELSQFDLRGWTKRAHKNQRDWWHVYIGFVPRRFRCFEAKFLAFIRRT